MPGTEIHAPNLRERTATPSSPEDLGNELNFLATLASQLEQQVDELERQHLSSTAEPGGIVFPEPYPSEKRGRFRGIAPSPGEVFIDKSRFIGFKINPASPSLIRKFGGNCLEINNNTIFIELNTCDVFYYYKIQINLVCHRA